MCFTSNVASTSSATSRVACTLLKGPSPMSNTKSRSTRRTGVGFTLVELMITVAIISVLAVLAAVGFASWIRHGKTAEATATLQAVRGAQETWFNDHAATQYLDISGTNGASVGTQWFPRATPNDQKAAWDTSACASVPCTGMKKLGVVADSFVYFVYGGTAGQAGTPAAKPAQASSMTNPVVNGPWYFLEAQGDLNGDGNKSDYWTSSWNTTVGSMNADE
jgi:prepilin-type N-terminal cleavage/methylation domain-containing protein